MNRLKMVMLDTFPDVAIKVYILTKKKYKIKTQLNRIGTESSNKAVTNVVEKRPDKGWNIEDTVILY